MALISLLNELPPPSSDKIGWPWTEESKPLPALMTDGNPWPKISVVTPSFNQGQFIEETIRSVLLQNYPNLEYIIMDGGSTDNTAEIIKKYEPWIKYWVSERDAGQSNAINKGFSISTGDILAWLNSDDIYLMNSLSKVAKELTKKNFNIIVGERLNISQDGYIINRQTISSRPVTLFQVLYMGRWPFYQESVLFTKDIWNRAGKLSEKYNLLFDFEFFVRCLHFCKALTLPGILLGCWRHHDLQKIHPDREIAVKREIADIFSIYRKKYYPEWLLKILWSLGRRTVWKNDKTVTISGNIREMRV